MLSRIDSRFRSSYPERVGIVLATKATGRVVERTEKWKQKRWVTIRKGNGKCDEDSGRGSEPSLGWEPPLVPSRDLLVFRTWVNYLEAGLAYVVSSPFSYMWDNNQLVSPGETVSRRFGHTHVRRPRSSPPRSQTKRKMEETKKQLPRVTGGSFVPESVRRERKERTLKKATQRDATQCNGRGGQEQAGAGPLRLAAQLSIFRLVGKRWCARCGFRVLWVQSVGGGGRRVADGF